MKIKAKDIYMSIQALEALMNNKIPIQTAYEISLVIEEVVRVYDIIEKQREKIIEKYGSENETGAFTIPETDLISLSQAGSEFDTYMLEDVDVDINKISISKFGNIDITINDIKALNWLLEK